MNAIREEEDSSKTPDVENDRRNGHSAMLELDLHLDLDDTFEIEEDAPSRVSPLAKEGERSRPRSQPDMSDIMRDSGIGNSIAGISRSPSNDSHLADHDLALVPLSHIDQDKPSATTSTSNHSQQNLDPANNKHVSNPKGSPKLSCHGNPHDNNNLKNFVNDNASQSSNPVDKIEMNYMQQGSKAPISADNDSGTHSCHENTDSHSKSSVPSPSRSNQGSEVDHKSLDSYEGLSFNDSTQHYPSTQDLVYM